MSPNHAAWTPRPPAVVQLIVPSGNRVVLAVNLVTYFQSHRVLVAGRTKEDLVLKGKGVPVLE